MRTWVLHLAACPVARTALAVSEGAQLDSAAARVRAQPATSPAPPGTTSTEHAEHAHELAANLGVGRLDKTTHTREWRPNARVASQALHATATDPGPPLGRPHPGKRGAANAAVAARARHTDRAAAPRAHPGTGHQAEQGGATTHAAGAVLPAVPGGQASEAGPRPAPGARVTGAPADRPADAAAPAAQAEAGNALAAGAPPGGVAAAKRRAQLLALRLATPSRAGPYSSREPQQPPIRRRGGGWSRGGGENGAKMPRGGLSGSLRLRPMTNL